MTGQARPWRPENSYWSAQGPCRIHLNHWAAIVLSIRWREGAAGWRWRATVPGLARGRVGHAPDLESAKAAGLAALRALYDAHPDLLAAHRADCRRRARLQRRARRGHVGDWLGAALILIGWVLALVIAGDPLSFPTP